jgi:hypothetical protein
LQQDRGACCRWLHAAEAQIDGMTAPFVYDGAMNGIVFRATLRSAGADTEPRRHRHLPANNLINRSSRLTAP